MAIAGFLKDFTSIKWVLSILSTSLNDISNARLASFTFNSALYAKSVASY